MQNRFPGVHLGGGCVGIRDSTWEKLPIGSEITEELGAQLARGSSP